MHVLKKLLRRSLIGLALLVLLAAGALALLPWKDYAAPLITQALRDKGLPVASLRIGAVGWEGVTLAPLVLDIQPPLTLPEVTLGWSLADITNPTLHSLTLRGMRHTLGSKSAETSAATSPPTIPVDAAFFAHIPLKQIRLEDMQLRIDHPSLQATLPFTASLSLQPTPVLMAEMPEATITLGKHTLLVQDLRLALTLEPAMAAWQGVLTLARLTHRADKPLIPPLSLHAPLTLDATSFTMPLTFSGDKEAYRLTLHHQFQQGSTKISDLSLPLAGGQITASPFIWGKDAPLSSTLKLEGVQLQPLLALLMEASGLKAEGVLDGSLPLHYEDGILRLGEGGLKAREAGVVAITGDSLSALGSEGQAGQVAALLGDFHYSLLQLSVEPAAQEEVTVRLKLEGNNPAVYDGKRVHLNVTIAGDVMKSLKGSLELLDASGDWLKKELQ